MNSLPEPEKTPQRVDHTSPSEWQEMSSEQMARINEHLKEHSTPTTTDNWDRIPTDRIEEEYEPSTAIHRSTTTEATTKVEPRPGCARPSDFDFKEPPPLPQSLIMLGSASCFVGLLLFLGNCGLGDVLLVLGVLMCLNGIIWHYLTKKKSTGSGDKN